MGGHVENKFIRHLHKLEKDCFDLYDMKQALATFRLTNKDLIPLCHELEEEGFMKRMGRMKFQLL